MAINAATLVPITAGSNRGSAEREDPSEISIRSLASLKEACDGFLSLEEASRHSSTMLLHEAAAGLHRFAASIVECEDAGLDRSLLLPYLHGLRRMHSLSPFVRRLQTWPRGYPGDFETVEWLCDARNRAPEGTIGWAIEQYALQSPVAQQHRNKVGLQARAILSAATARRRARIGSLGCGGCRDLSLIQDYIAGSRASFVLVDADSDALAFAQERLHRLAGKCEFVQGRVPRILPNIASGGPFNLIVAGGLFDYLPDRWAESTLRSIHGLLAPGGTVLFSNIARGNPFRTWLEYLADWHLIERDESDLRRLLESAGFGDGDVHIFRDTSALAFMVEVRPTGNGS